MPGHPLFGFRRGPLSQGVFSNRYVEPSFLSLLAVSLLLHLIGFTLLYLWRPAAPAMPEPTFIDLQDLQQLPLPEARVQPEKIRPSDRRQRVERETAPRQPRLTPAPPVTSTPSRPSTEQPPSRQPEPGGSSAGELLRRRSPQPQASRQPDMARLMPSAGRMAQIEENYRRRFADDVADGDTRFLNSDDVMFGSFLRRFETAVYGVWRYPQEAALKGIEGVTPVRITFNRNGEIVNIRLLESSGSKLLDDEVFRTLRLLGPMGSLPRTYPKDEFHLIAFFQYGNARGRLR
ncbi:TonB family protein [Trichlorobacter ammonificans]|uniref:TonB family protein n=2 Tax=Trichlorobacter ammonificans TaxID=2916410 RepID=A0ABM9D9D8_9BACT|nr:TonB family protein [Trichlorobacter ammonificans]